MVNLGERLKKLRMEKQITQAEISRRTGISKVMLSSYELEQRSPSYEVLIKLASFFGTSTDYLLGLEKSRTLNVEGLTDDEVGALVHMIDVLRKR